MLLEGEKAELGGGQECRTPWPFPRGLESGFVRGEKWGLSWLPPRRGMEGVPAAVSAGKPDPCQQAGVFWGQEEAGHLAAVHKGKNR